MPAEQDQVFLSRKFPGHLLVKNPSPGGHIEDSGVLSAPLSDTCLDEAAAVIDRLGLHQHSGPAAIRIIVDFLVFVCRIIPYINCVNRYYSRIGRTFEYARVKSVFNHLRE